MEFISGGGGEPPTKQFWVPVTYSLTMTNYGRFPVARLALTADAGFVSFHVPDDFHNIVEAKAVVIARWTGNDLYVVVYSEYGKHGEAYNTHTGSDWLFEFDVVADNIYEDSLSAALADLGAGDYVGLSIRCADGARDNDVLGVMFKYD